VRYNKKGPEKRESCGTTRRDQKRGSRAVQQEGTRKEGVVRYNKNPEKSFVKNFFMRPSTKPIMDDGGHRVSGPCSNLILLYKVPHAHTHTPTHPHTHTHPTTHTHTPVVRSWPIPKQAVQHDGACAPPHPAAAPAPAAARH